MMSLSEYNDSLEQLAVDMGNLRYVELANFLSSYAFELESHHIDASLAIHEAYESIRKAWIICLPYEVLNPYHPTNLLGYESSLDILAKELSSSQIQSAEFLSFLALDLERQAMQDSTRGRKHLSTLLYNSADELYSAHDALLGLD